MIAPSASQISFIYGLCNDIESEVNKLKPPMATYTALMGPVEQIKRQTDELVCRTEAKLVIEMLIVERDRLRTIVKSKPPVVLDLGMYQREGVIYKIQKSRSSGNLYAKKLFPPTNPDDDAKFEYAPGAVYRLQPEDRLSLEKAKELGALYGTCIVCGRLLKATNSVAESIGPVCKEKV